MDNVINLFNGLLSEVGAIYSIVLMAIGFASGILTWRWYKNPWPGTHPSPQLKETQSLERELEGLVSATSALWEKTKSPSIQRPREDGTQTIYAAPKHSRWRTFSQRIFKRASEHHNETAELAKFELKGNLE